MKYLNSEHISAVAAILWSQTGGDPDKAVERAIHLQKISFTKCQALNKQTEEAEAKEREFHNGDKGPNV